MSKKNPSRADRLKDIKEELSHARSIAEEQQGRVEELKDEMQNWLDSIPENLQGGDKYQSIEEAISNLEEMYSYLDDATSAIDSADGTEVEFPGMFG